MELAALECLKNQFLVLWPLDQASSFLIRSSIKKKKKKKKKKIFPVTVLVDSQVSDRCPWATCYVSACLFIVHKIF